MLYISLNLKLKSLIYIYAFDIYHISILMAIAESLFQGNFSILYSFFNLTLDKKENQECYISPGQWRTRNMS